MPAAKSFFNFFKLLAMLVSTCLSPTVSTKPPINDGSVLASKITSPPTAAFTSSNNLLLAWYFRPEEISLITERIPSKTFSLADCAISIFAYTASYSPHALMNYLCTEQYHAPYDHVVAWNDPDIAIEWPIEAQSVSDRDRNAPLLREVALENLPRMHA